MKRRNNYVMLLVVVLIFVQTANRGWGEVFSASGLPLEIPEYTSHTISLLNVPAAGKVEDVNLFINLEHEDMGDLEIFLSKDDQIIQIFNRHGTGSQDLNSITFDDEAAVPINEVLTPFGPGVFQPTSSPQPGMENCLSAFDYMTCTGEWRLDIQDTWPDSEDGLLLEWSLEITICYTPGDANKDGYVDSSDLVILSKNWLKSEATWEMGDFNDDQIVDGIDAAHLAVNWQPASAQAFSVPEPGTTSMMIFLMFGCWFVYMFRKKE